MKIKTKKNIFKESKIESKIIKYNKYKVKKAMEL
jgi:hypothetical protein